MAYLTSVYTNTLNDQNINTALLIGTFTNTTRIRKFWINVFLYNVAGGATGDYYAYVTWQRAGAGDFCEAIRTSKPAAVGTTAITFETITLVTSTATDVIRVYVLGLAGDNVGAVDAIVDVNEEWIDIDANGRVDVGEWLGSAPAALSASGYVQAMLLRWLTDNAAGTPLALLTNLVQVAGSIAAGGITAGSFAAGAITAAAIATDAIDADALATDAADEIADHVWDEAIAGHLGVGSTGAALNATTPGAPVVLNSEITQIHTT